MKTRRILAASTAALLAFGTTAAYVASAAVSTGEVGLAAASGTPTGGEWQAKVDGANATADTDIAGQEVTIETEPDDGYEVASITAVANNGTSSTDLTVSGGKFTMPAVESGKAVTVTVTVTFQKTAKTLFNEAVPAVADLADFGDFEADVLYDVAEGVQMSATESALKKLEKYSIGAARDGWTTLDTCFTANGNNIGTKTGIFAMTDKKYNNALKKALDIKSGVVKNGTKKMQVFNIEVGYSTDAGNETANKKITLGAKVLVRLQSSVDGTLYHLSSDGKTLEKVDAAVSKGINDDAGSWFYTFETNTFSPFVVAAVDIGGLATMGNQAGDYAEDPDAATSDADSAATSNGSSTTNPETGIALAIAPVVLAAGAVAVVALKKKH